MLHYYARKFFAPILISPYFNGSDFNVYMVVDEIPLFEKKESGVNKFVPASNYIDILKSSFPRTESVHLMTKTADATMGTLYIEMYSWDNFTPLQTWNTTYKVLASSWSELCQTFRL